MRLLNFSVPHANIIRENQKKKIKKIIRLTKKSANKCVEKLVPLAA